VLAFALLFQNNTSLKLENPDLLLDGKITSRLLLSNCHMDFKRITIILEKMAKLASTKLVRKFAIIYN